MRLALSGAVLDAPGGSATSRAQVAQNAPTRRRPLDGSSRIIALGGLSSVTKEALRAADAYLKAHIKNLGIDREPRQYDFTIQAVNLNQAKEGAETAIAFCISLVSALLEKSVDPQTLVIGEVSVKSLLHRVNSLPERLELARAAGAKRILIPSENKRDIADVPDEVLNKLEPVFYTDPSTRRSLPCVWSDCDRPATGLTRLRNFFSFYTNPPNAPFSHWNGSDE